MAGKGRARWAAAAALALLLAAGALFAGGGPDAPAAVRKPNIVLITTDDQTLASMAVMPRVRRLLVDRGATFTDNIASFPLCCPSRATWITGEYAHNHGVIDNQERDGGGYEALRDPDRVLPVWMDQAGYDTALVGKWLHDYRTLKPAPGWDRFWAITAPTMVNYYGYDVTDSHGGRVRYGKKASDYVTDVLTRDYALPYIREHARDHDPFFLHVSYIAPHWGRGRNDAAGRRCSNGKPFSFETAKAKPAPRDAGAFCEPQAADAAVVQRARRQRQAGPGARPRPADPAADPRPDGEVPVRARQPARGRSRRGRDRRGPRRGPPDQADVRDLHLRQRLHARRAPDPGGEGPALRGGDQGPAGDPRSRRARRGADHRPGRQRRPRADDPRPRRGSGRRGRSRGRSTGARWRRTPTGAASRSGRS